MKGRSARCCGARNPATKVSDEVAVDIWQRAQAGESCVSIHCDHPMLSYSRVHGIASGVKRAAVDPLRASAETST